MYLWIKNLQAKTWRLGPFYMEKSYPEREGHAPSPVNFSDRLGTGYFSSPGERNLADPPFECNFTEVIPPKTLDDCRVPHPPHVFIFRANLSGPPSESFQSFSAIPPFVLPKSSDPPSNPPPPRPKR